MEYSSYFKNEIKIPDKWELLESRYNKFKNRERQEQKIPKIIHQIWLGKDMPNAEKQRCENIKNNISPDWEYKLWRDSDVDNLGNFHNKHLYDTATNLGQKSDILRLFLLLEYGGIYCDTDFVFLGSFDELLDLDFFCGVAYDSEPNILNSIIGSSLGNNIIKKLQMFDKPLASKDAMDVIDTTGPYFLTRRIFECFKEEHNMVVLPNSFFYPYPNFTINKTLGDDWRNYIKPETICCHLWACSWM